LKKAVSWILLILLLISMWTLAFDGKIVKADGTIPVTIREDGSIYPATAPISTSDNVTYFLTDNFTADITANNQLAVIIQRSNIVLDGLGNTLAGVQTGSDTGYDTGILIMQFVTIGVVNVVTMVDNVTIENLKITGFSIGVGLFSTSNDTISGNVFTENLNDGIEVFSSSYNIISGNSIVGSGRGIDVGFSNNNTVMGNNMENDGAAIQMLESSNNYVTGNSIKENSEGIFLEQFCSGNRIYHNNFMNNTLRPTSFSNMSNFWDEGYPLGGNYYDDYNGTDLHSGPYQNLTGSDGIGDTPYFISANNTDYYPLMTPWSPHDIAITRVLTSRIIVYRGFNTSINVTATNIGTYPEDAWITLYCNITSGKSIGQYPLHLDMGQSFTMQFVWNTAEAPYGTYMLTAVATIPAGSHSLSSGNITVRVPGDVDGNGRVDLRDIALVARALGSTPGSPNWNPAADINGDSVVNMQDITLVAKHFGQQTT
jgi:parallel beta-helix repeat protein